MSYQYQPSDCAPADTDDHFQEQIQQDLNSIVNIVPSTIRLAVWFFTNIIPFVLAFVIVYFIAGKVTIGSVLIMVLLSIMIYIFINNMTGSNMVGALPRSTYPVPPHLGLDGISSENRSCVGCL